MRNIPHTIAEAKAFCPAMVPSTVETGQSWARAISDGERPARYRETGRDHEPRRSSSWPRVKRSRAGRQESWIEHCHDLVGRSQHYSSKFAWSHERYVNVPSCFRSMMNHVIDMCDMMLVTSITAEPRTGIGWSNTCSRKIVHSVRRSCTLGLSSLPDHLQWSWKLHGDARVQTSCCELEIKLGPNMSDGAIFIHVR